MWLFGIRINLSWLFLRDALKSKYKLPFVSNIYIYKGSLHVSEFHPGGPGGGDDSKSLEILIGGEGNLQLLSA